MRCFIILAACLLLTLLGVVNGNEECAFHPNNDDPQLGEKKCKCDPPAGNDCIYPTYNQEDGQWYGACSGNTCNCDCRIRKDEVEGAALERLNHDDHGHELMGNHGDDGDDKWMDDDFWN